MPSVWNILAVKAVCVWRQPCHTVSDWPMEGSRSAMAARYIHTRIEHTESCRPDHGWVILKGVGQKLPVGTSSLTARHIDGIIDVMATTLELVATRTRFVFDQGRGARIGPIKHGVGVADEYKMKLMAEGIPPWLRCCMESATRLALSTRRCST